MGGNNLVFAGTLILATAIVAALPIRPAQAQTAAPKTPAAAVSPKATTATYDDWLLRCEAQPDAAKVCEVVQGIQSQQGLIAQIVVGRIAKTDPFSLIVQLPAGVWLPAGAAIEFGDKTAPLPLAYSRCQQSCFADLVLKPEQVEALKTSKAPVSLVFEDGARNRIQLPISLNGFAPALEASQKQ